MTDHSDFLGLDPYALRATEAARIDRRCGTVSALFEALAAAELSITP